MKGSLVYILLGLAVIAALSALSYTFLLTKQLSQSEKHRIELWSEAYKEIQQVDVNQQISPLILKIIKSNKTIPVILLDEQGNIISYANLDSIKSKSKKYLQKQLEIMKSQHEPIEITLGEKERQYLYYKDSRLLTMISYFPIVQLVVVIIFLIVIFFAAKNVSKVEEQKLWVLMSKETAHQLGTPLSSLVAWIEMLKLMDIEEELIKEVEKDLKHLEAVSERFSSIGTLPKLEKHNIENIIKEVVDYLKVRTSKKIKYQIKNTVDKPYAYINKILFAWALENISKNAIDAMEGKGRIKFNISEDKNFLYIDITDTGKGMSRKIAKKIFNSGFTTKKHGWGMGLTLSKRIINNYHKGKIFVLNSSPGKGTTFRIALKKTI